MGFLKKTKFCLTFKKKFKPSILLKKKMSGDDLNSYKLQMQQVDAALTSDPNNPELLTLKADLQQVIDLTEELITEQQTKSESDIPTEGSEEITRIINVVVFVII